MPKPSPVASIFMFVGSVFLLWAAFSSSWFSHSFEDNSFSVGLLRVEECVRGECRSQTLFSGRLRGPEMFALLIWALTFAGLVCAVISGFFLLKPGRSVLAVIAMCLVAGAALFAVFLILVISKGRGVSYGVGVFFLGTAGVVTGAIMAMTRPAPPRPQMPYRPMGMPPMGMPMANPYAQPYAPPQANPYAAPAQQQPPGPSPYAPPQQQASAQGAPCQTCQSPTTWVAQYNRWFCARCQKYS
jgi:hypothetical protein